MRLIDINAFLRREEAMSTEMQVERRAKVFDFRDDEATEYAILSHRWIGDTEVNYDEMADLAKMEKGDRDEIRERAGYKKILDTCRQAQKDGYEWVWVDTCCIDKRSSAELSEAINSMYRWYANAKACYAYLHDVDGSSFPTKKDNEKYPKSNGWPEWFSRGWTLQEMIAPSDVQFFNENWEHIGTKKTRAPMLSNITGVPAQILRNGLNANRPCVARIMSWATNRTTTRVEDRAYSLMGLLDVNMPMLYGEGRKAFHRLQLEIIRSSNDQTVFAWGHASNVRIGSILADDPSFFVDCSDMELLDHDQFIQLSKSQFPELGSMDADDGVFPVTNRGIQIWMLLCPYPQSKSIFRAYLPCRNFGFPLAFINVVLWNSNYYRYPNMWEADLEDSPEFRQVYLRYQDTPDHTVTFEFDDSGLIENGFTCFNGDPEGHAGNAFMLTNANHFHLCTYFDEQSNCCLKVVFGQCLGWDWVHLEEFPLGKTSPIGLVASIASRGPDWTLPISNGPFHDDFYGELWIRHFYLSGSPWVVQIYRVMWERSKIGLRMEVFHDRHFRNGPDKWEAYNVEVSGFPLYVHGFLTSSFIEV